MRKSKKKIGGERDQSAVMQRFMTAEQQFEKQQPIMTDTEKNDKIINKIYGDTEKNEEKIEISHEVQEARNKIQKKYSQVDAMKLTYNNIEKYSTLYLKLIDVKDTTKQTIKNDMFKMDIFNNIVKAIQPDGEKAETLTNYVKTKFEFEFERRGGQSLLDRGVRNDVNNEYDYFNTFMKSNTITDGERNNLENIIDNIGAGGPVNNIIIRGVQLDNLKTFIEANRTDDNDSNIIINLGKKYDFSNNINASNLQGANLTYQLQYNYKNYNKNIVESFQKNFIDNHNNIRELINLHNGYIDGLVPYKKYTINDYTNPNGYRFYSKYFKSGRGDWLNIYKGRTRDAEDDRNKFAFGDAFLYQIKHYCDILDCSNELRDKINERLINQRKNHNDLSDFKDLLNQEQWGDILTLFEQDLQDIIIRAPTINKEIYCYRGVSKHVIENQTATQDPNVSLQCYYTSRITSFSISFDCSKSFYTSYDAYDHTNISPEACIYRTTIMRGANMLFIEPLTTCQYEYEIITPTDTIIVDPLGFDGDRSTTTLPSLNQYLTDHTKNIKYNNIDNRYGISGKLHDQIKSLDIIIVGSPPPPPLPRRGEILPLFHMPRRP
jgi:hypothetical protein